MPEGGGGGQRGGWEVGGLGAGEESPSHRWGARGKGKLVIDHAYVKLLLYIPIIFYSIHLIKSAILTFKEVNFFNFDQIYIKKY